MLPVGRRLGVYDLLEPTGQGGMGQVYKARDTRLDRIVAIKILSGSSADSAERVRREARAAAALNHPNLCTLYEIASEGELPYIVMEYVEGRPLSEVIGGGLALAAVSGYGVQIAEALVHAHARGVLHRDLKSANVMITGDGRVKVLDFGIAQRLRESRDGTTETAADAGLMAGTLPYMAPETLRGERSDHRVDIWSFGVVLYEMAAGRRPFDGRTTFATSTAILRDDPASLDAPMAFAAIVSRCLQKNPADRYQSAAEVRAALEEAAGGRIVLPDAAPRIRSIAVLPLENHSADPAQEYFADGMTEALIANLARIRALRVISRTSIMRYKHAKTSLPEIARELNVDAVVEGSALRAGERVRITAQLIHALTDSLLWTETYDRDARDVLALQSDVARAIAHEIRIQVTPQEQARLGACRPVDPEAYSLYLQGRYWWNRMGDAQFRRSIQYFEQALSRDPEYAPALAGVADYYNVLAWFGWARPNEVVPRARDAARRAVALDDTLVEGHAALAYTAIYYDWNWPLAERELLRALELNPGHAMTHQYYSWFLAMHGKMAESVVEAERARSLDPLSVLLNAALGQQYFLTRDYKRAIAQLQQTIEMDPNIVVAKWALAWVFLQQRRFPEAIQHLQSVLQLTGGEEYLPWLAYAYAMAGMRAESGALLQQLLAKATREYVPPDDIARIHIGLGDHDAAFDWLNRALQERSGWVPYLAVDPAIDPLRSDPRLPSLLERVGLKALQ